MKKAVLQLKSDFKIVLGNHTSQAAEMVIAPGAAEGGPASKHRGADQWLFVLSGEGLATINGETHQLTRNTLLLIERGDTHEIRNTGTTPLQTLNFYVPPAYDREGNELPAGKV